jgi:threonyl-tRNA synthetase
MNNLSTLRHSAEHVLMQALNNLYPGKILPAMGPSTDDGFYYDFDSLIKFTEENFSEIESEMNRIIKADLPIIKKEISADEARKLFQDNPYKQEWIAEAEDRGDPITVFWTGSPEDENSFIDLCSGPHTSSTGEIKAFKLLSVAGAYWRGSEKNKMLTRIYGTAFNTKEELSQYLQQIETAKKNDHRKLGKHLDLFTFSELVGSGLPLFTPKGTIVRQLLNGYVESLQASQGYQQVWTPQITRAELFKTSGHYDKYKDSMFRVISNYSDEEFFLKPMNCPQHTQIYASQSRSYRDLPLRYTDFAMLYRDEKPGELSGLARVRSFSQDDCHIFCREDQVDAEVDIALSMTKEIMTTFGFKYKYRLSTRDLKHPEKYIGDPKTWDKTEKWAETIMKRNHIDYFDGPGEAAFYAPKMDLIATDALGREWQLSTLQIDYVLPERFNLSYVDKDGSEKRPIMLHRAIIGSSERFIMILLEQFAGAFPVWLSPNQVTILPISEKFTDYTKTILSQLKEQEIRTELDTSAESLGKKIRNAESQRTPYMLIIGEKEVSQNLVSVRQRGEKDLGQMTIEQFIAKISSEINQKVIF